MLSKVLQCCIVLLSIIHSQEVQSCVAVCISVQVQEGVTDLMPFVGTKPVNLWRINCMYFTFFPGFHCSV